MQPESQELLALSWGSREDGEGQRQAGSDVEASSRSGAPAAGARAEELQSGPPAPPGKPMGTPHASCCFHRSQSSSHSASCVTPRQCGHSGQKPGASRGAGVGVRPPWAGACLTYHRTQFSWASFSIRQNFLQGEGSWTRSLTQMVQSKNPFSLREDSCSLNWCLHEGVCSWDLDLLQGSQVTPEGHSGRPSPQGTPCEHYEAVASHSTVPSHR